MTLFELEALLKLNTDNFANGLTSAQTTMNSFATDLDNDIRDIESSMAALDDEIASLDAEIEAMEKENRNLGFKGAFLEGFYGGLTEAAGELLEEVIQAGFEYLGDSVELAADSGSDAADKYNLAMQRLEVGAKSLKMAIGNSLLPTLTAAADGIANLLGVSDYEVGFSMLEQLNAYEFENLQQAEKSLSNIFEFGEAYVAEESEAMAFEDVLAGIKSQEDYWKQYIDTMEQLKGRGVSGEILSMYSSGSASDLNQLSWFASLSDAELAMLEDATARNDDARAAAAAYLSAMTLGFDSEYQAMKSEYDNFMDSLDRGGGRRWESNDQLTIESPAASEQIEALNTTVGQLKDIVAAIPSQAVAAAANVIDGASVVMDGSEVGRLIVAKITRDVAGKRYG